MPVHATPPTDEERLAALRRRLYAPGATDEDVAAYRAVARPARPADDAVPPAGRAADAGGPSRRAAVVVLGAVVVGGAALLGTVRLVAGERPRPTASPAPTRDPRLTSAVLPASAATRDRFAAALQGGESAGLLDYLYGHPSYLPAAMRAYGRADSTEYAGQGTSTIALAPSRDADRGGRFTVVLVADRAASFSWRAERLAERNDRSGPVVAMATHAGTLRAGEPASCTLAYDDGAPSRLAVYVDETVKWGAVAVFTD